MDIRDIQIRVNRLRAEQAAQVLDHMVQELVELPAIPIGSDAVLRAIERGIESLYAAPVSEPQDGQKPNVSGFARFFAASAATQAGCAAQTGGAR